MRKIYEVHQSVLIKCDNPRCDFSIPNESGDPNTDTSEYVDMPCPKCDANLLTKKDYQDGLKVMGIINWVNKWFSWLTIFSFRKSEYVKAKIDIHNGVNMKIEKPKKDKK